jgi:uncharacterized delta-60 repeat protein
MWFGLSRKPRPASRTRPPARRLAVELLEDRLTPSTGGLLDPTFGSGGHVFSSFTNNNDQANAVVAQPDGKVVIAGYTQAPGSATGFDFLVARYNADGSLDTSFGSGGHTATDFGSTAKFVATDAAYAVALQPQADGTSKIVAAGLASMAQKKGSISGVGVARYNANGTLDTTFGTSGNGRVVTPVGLGDWETMAVDGSGRIVVAGGSSGMATLVRYTPNGALDTSFGTGGVLITNISTRGIVKVAVQPDSKIVLLCAPNSTEFITARFNVNGTADSTFGSGGVVTTQLGGNENGVAGVAVQGDGKIVVGGAVAVPVAQQYTNEETLLRYNADGSLDATFGTGGVVTVPMPNEGGASALVLQADGKIIASGTANGGYFAALRVNPDGSVDTGYGTGGVAAFQVGPGSLERAMALEPDGRLLLAGTDALNNPNGPTEVALVRFLGSAPQVGSFTASPNPVASGSSTTLTASNISDGNPNYTIKQVAFYYIDGTGTKQVLGYGTADGLGNWVLSFTVNLAPGTYTLYAQAEDGYGAFGDPLALTLTVQ